MIKLIILILIIANFFAVLFLSPLVLLQYAAIYIYKKTAGFFRKYFEHRKRIELKV